MFIVYIPRDIIYVTPTFHYEITDPLNSHLNLFVTLIHCIKSINMYFFIALDRF